MGVCSSQIYAFNISNSTIVEDSANSGDGSNDSQVLTEIIFLTSFQGPFALNRASLAERFRLIGATILCKLYIYQICVGDDYNAIKLTAFGTLAMLNIFREAIQPRFGESVSWQVLRRHNRSFVRYKYLMFYKLTDVTEASRRGATSGTDPDSVPELL